MFWSVTVSLITCDSTHEPYTQHGLVTGQLMNPSSNRNLKHVGYDTWNMCHAYVTLSGGYVSSLSTSCESGPSGWSSADTVHSASVKLDMGSIPSASHNATSITAALPMPISNLSNCRCTSISCIRCKKQKKVNKSGHTRDASDSVAGASQGCFKLMVSTSESDLYLSSSSKDLVSDVGLLKGSESMSGEW